MISPTGASFECIFHPDLHVLSRALSLVLLIGGNVEDGTGGDGKILIVLGVTGTDLRTLGVKGNGNRTAGLDLLSLASIVNDGLCRRLGVSR